MLLQINSCTLGMTLKEQKHMQYMKSAVPMYSVKATAQKERSLMKCKSFSVCN